MADNSDYNKPRTNLIELLPDVFRSDTNRSVFENLFNRFLTKEESTFTAGYIGEGNPNAITSRQIQEPTLHRQAFQLQPILYNKVGSVEHMASWKNILVELDRLGVDIERLPIWGAVQQFNWVPPVDIDKLIHFEDYYWYDEENPTSSQQYITMRSRCTTAIANVNFWQSLIDEYGETIPVQSISSVDATLPTYDIKSLTSTGSPLIDRIVVSGDVTSELNIGEFFTINGTVSNDGEYAVLTVPVFDNTVNESTIIVSSGSLTDEFGVGTLNLRRYDKLVFDGAYGDLFEPGFVFFFKNSTNVELNNSFWQVADSDYDETVDTTTVQLTAYFTDDTANGDVSLTEQLSIFQADRDCQCSGGTGWDTLQWDDNPAEPLWDGDFNTLLTMISNPGPPVTVAGSPGGTAQDDLWYDTTADILYQYDTVNGWKLIYNQFSLILEKTEGLALWDFTEGCDMPTRVPSASQWTAENKWLHKSDVPNFSIAKQAAYPILEYDWDLEINEWTYTTYNWKYRVDQFTTFDETQLQPSRIELQPISLWEFDDNTGELVLDDRYGDLTTFFTTGTLFQAENTTEIYEVEYSSYVAEGQNHPYQTRVKIAADAGQGSPAAFELIPGDITNKVESLTPLRPARTANGDPWKGYGIHWLFVGANNAVPVNHQPDNPFILPEPGAPVTEDQMNGVEYIATQYSQTFTVLSDTPISTFILTSDVGGSPQAEVTSRSLQERALLGNDDVRVYINEIRQYGNYNEIAVGSPAIYVGGIEFLPGNEPNKLDEVRIEVGEATITELGNYHLPVRMHESDDDYATFGDIDVSLIQYRRAEQVKTLTNQYPLFDIYYVDGTSANEANPIFGYLTSDDAPVNPLVGQRTVFDAANRVYSFDQFLIDEDDGILKAYRDYALHGNDTWYNPLTGAVRFFNNLSWSSYSDMGGHWRQAIVSEFEPNEREQNIDGLIWVDTLNGVVFSRNVSMSRWDVVTDVDVRNSDSSLQTIWKGGLNNEEYVPEKVDWDGRSETEYNSERDLYIEETADELLLSDPSLTEAQATAQAASMWLSLQSNDLSPTGVWVGDWEIPDPLYHNHLNENRKVLTSQDLLTHFQTIIDSQPKIPGYGGQPDSMFHLIPTNEVNYGVGGTIKEFNDSYDTALSSTFVNNVTVPGLLEFAQDQYESMLNVMEELYVRNALTFYTNVSQDFIIDFANQVANSVIDQYELNDNASHIYGDTTVFTDVEGGDDLGIKNWIATLPYLKLLFATEPLKLTDTDIDLTQILHHDGHRKTYSLEESVISLLTFRIINEPDDRTRFPGPTDPPLDTFGRESTNLPPNDIVEFSSEFSTTILNRDGVYWNHSPTGRLYRLVVADIGDQEPSVSLEDGTLWMDMTPGSEVLRVKDGNSWNPVPGNTIGDGRLHNGTTPSDVTTATHSAWSVVNLNEVLADIILEVETRLYGNVPDFRVVRYDTTQLENSYPVEYNAALEQSFLEYATQNEITSPLLNTEYDPADPFTWNYKYSSPGSRYTIVETDSIANTISVQGNHINVFDPCSNLGFCPSTTNFFVKNSNGNDGTWSTLTSTLTGSPADPLVDRVAVYDSGNDVTTISVSADVVEDTTGTAYIGTLPSSLNDGSESGGDWRDLYDKLYGTPFPHLEPWKLQGYDSKPAWWDGEYLNDDTEKWGNRRWKYSHGFDIVDTDLTENSFIVTGDFRDAFPVGLGFTIDNSTTHNGTYAVDSLLTIGSVVLGVELSAQLIFSGDQTSVMFPGLMFAVNDSNKNYIASFTVNSSIYDGVNTTVTVQEAIEDATGYVFVGGTTYNGITNQSEIRVTSSLGGSPAAVADGRITHTVGMWENIRRGFIKAGERYPNRVLSVTGEPSTDVSVHGVQDPMMPTYNYFSVNIANSTIDGFQSDDVFPPFWDYVATYGTSPALIDTRNRSVFFNAGAEVITPSADYAFGDSGPVEFDWKISSQFLYDQLLVAYKLDPIRMVTHTFGIDFLEIADLQIDTIKERVLSHNRTDFHGEIVNDQLLQFAGSNQWYVNYNRFTGFDLSLADFRELWTGWTAPMTYQFSSFVDTSTLNVAHRTVPITDFDYEVSSKRSPAVEDFWHDAFRVSVTRIPPKVIRYNNEGEWRFSVNTNASRSRSISYYDVHNYQFRVDENTDTGTIYSWLVEDANTFNDTFNVSKDQTHLFVANRTFVVSDSTNNNGSYTVRSSVYDSTSDQTIITVVEQVPSIVADGNIQLNYRALPWTTGDGVYLSTSEMLPAPLRTDNVNGLYEYFVIVVDDTAFQLALTRQDAINGNAVDITSIGRGDHFVGQVAGTFTALGGSLSDELWRRYSVDKENILTLTTPSEVHGMQNWINIVHGYDVYSHDQGWRVNSDSSILDPTTDRFAGWQLEIERFINYAFSLRITREQIADTYAVSVDDTTDTFTFLEDNSHFITGDAVVLLPGSGLAPAPLVGGVRYYIIRDTFDEFKLALTKLEAQNGNAIGITSTAGVSNLKVTFAKEPGMATPTFEMNPIRNGVWFRPARGILSDLLVGPTEDIRNEQLLFDQYGRPMTLDQLRIFREDKETQIMVKDELPNDVEIGSDNLNPYQHIHLGGAHVFIDTYEHVLRFNNYTTADNLLYDPFIGLNVTKIELAFGRQPEFTQRPNMGGFYYNTFFNQNAGLSRNIEAQIEDLRYAYDTYNVNENNIIVKHSRDGLGYEGSKEYLDNLNLNDKSQFAFWRGQIQHKGSLEAVDAFISSRRFIDAKVDEFWAYKLADFGSANEKEYPEIYLTSRDARSNDFRAEFITVLNPVADDTFESISGSDEERWYNQPNQVQTLRDNGQNLYFDMKVCASKTFNQPTNVGGSPAVLPIYRHNLQADLVTVTVDRANEGKFLVYDKNQTSMSIGDWLTTGGTGNIILFPNHVTRSGGDDDIVVGANHITVWIDGVELIPGVDFAETEASSPGSPSLALGTTSTIEIQPHVGFDGASQSLEVLIKPVVLEQGTHFEYINTNIIRLLDNEVINSSLTKTLTVWGYNANEDAQNPARLIDRESETLISAIQIWDPARDHQYHNSVHNITVMNNNDPAVYNNGVNVNQSPNGPWGDTKVGTTWMDNTELDYVPYYDNYSFPNVEDRLRYWGQLAPWASAPIYEWVESDVHPSEWDALAAEEEGNTSIEEKERKSGIAKFTLFELDGSTWVPVRNKFEEFDPSIDGSNNGDGTYTFTLTNPDLLPVGSPNSTLFDVYVNGILVESGTTNTTVECTEVDRVRFVLPVPTDQAVIDEGVTNGTLLQDYQFSTITYFDKLGQERTKYFFWVGQKSTRPSTSRTMSAKDAEVDFISIPVPYMALQKAEQEGDIIVESNKQVARRETRLPVGSPGTFTLSLPIAENSDVFVEADGVDVVQSDISFVELTNEVTVNPTAYAGAGNVTITYTGIYDDTVTVPNRFVQSVIRGLRGLVDADRRYTVRYTRDFTLRDSLEQCVDPLNLKNQHQEWKIFREEQQSHIDRNLWDRVTESIIGYKLNDPSVRVPSLDRELYDSRYLTDTRYGLGDGQSFTNGELALSSILADLEDPNNDFDPVDINVFFMTYSFDTPENIIEAMDVMYSTFSYEHVNRMYFSVLHDAFSVKSKYPDIFKTSMIAVHGIRPFQVAGVFDD